MNPPPKPFFTLEDIRKDRSILTSFSNPGTPVKSFDGLCGNLIGEILVTSPNMKVLYKPPLNECRVRLRKDRHFGLDDPLYHPQPFLRAAAHLALIRVPQTAGPFSTAWIIPDLSHFTPTLETFCTGFGVLQRDTRLQLEKLSQAVVEALPEGHGEDFYMKSNLEQLRRLMDRLKLAAPMEEVFLRYRCAQRQILELDARSRWVKDFREGFGMSKKVDQEGAGLADDSIMGAFTENLDELENLFQSKIPVYFVRRISRAGEARIDKIEQFIRPFANDTIQLHTEFIVDLSDAAPSHRVIFTGLPRNPERYITMSNYIASLFEYPSVLGTTQPRSSISIQKASLPFTPAMPIRQSSQVSRGRSSPYPKGKAGKGKPQSNPVNNTFIVPSSPLMPTPIEAWKTALEHLSGYNQALRPPEGVDRGYALPPPDMFINVGNEVIAVALFRNWLKLRDIFVYRLLSHVDRFSKKQWRQMLTLDDDKELRSDTRTGQHRLESQRVLKEVMGKSKLQFQNLSSAPVAWRGQTVDGTKIPPQRIAKEILWELYEINFRQDLVALDGRLDESGMSLRDRCAVLDACWFGTRDYAQFPDANRGFASNDPQRRVKVVRALYTLMATWGGEKPPVLLYPFPEDSGSHNFGIRLDSIARELASHYTRSFLEVFGRAASIPFRLA